MSDISGARVEGCLVTGLMRVSYVSVAILCPGTSSVFRVSLGGSSLGRVARGKGPFSARQFPRESRPREGPELSQLWGQGHSPFACGHVIIGLRGATGARNSWLASVGRTDPFRGPAASTSLLHLGYLGKGPVRICLWSGCCAAPHTASLCMCR